MGGVQIDRTADPSTYQINNSLSTVSTLLNSMVGGTMLMVPVLFMSTGIISSVVVLIIAGFVSWQTCDIYITHLRKDQFDIQETIKRLLGRRWYTLFNIISSCNLLILTIFYFYIMCNFIYDAMVFCRVLSNPNEEFVVIDYHQMLILSSIVIVPCALLLFLQKLTLLVQIAEYGVYSIYAYGIFIIYNFIRNIPNITNYNFSEANMNNKITFNWFSWDIGPLGGTAAMAFTIHTTVGPIIKCAQDQTKNQKNLLITFICGFFIYFINGIIGYLGILNKSKPDEIPSTILDFFSPYSVELFLVQLIYLVHLITMFPINFNICRMRVYEVVYGVDQVPPYWFMVLLNVICLGCCYLIRNIQGLQADYISNFNGAVCCFFLIYVFPIVMHFSCYYGYWRHRRNSTVLLQSFHNDPTNNPDINHNTNSQESFKDSFKQSQYDQHIQEKVQQLNLERRNCSPHPHIDSTSLSNRIAFYSFIGVIGVATLIYGLYQTFLPLYK